MESLRGKKGVAPLSSGWGLGSLCDSGGGSVDHEARGLKRAACFGAGAPLDLVLGATHAYHPLARVELRVNLPSPTLVLWPGLAMRPLPKMPAPSARGLGCDRGHQFDEEATT